MGTDGIEEKNWPLRCDSHRTIIQLHSYPCDPCNPWLVASRNIGQDIGPLRNDGDPRIGPVFRQTIGHRLLDRRRRLDVTVPQPLGRNAIADDLHLAAL